MGIKEYVRNRSIKADVGNRTKASELTLRQSIFPLTLVTALFFLWGFSYGLLDTLNAHFQRVLHFTPSRSSGLQAAYFGYVVWLSGDSRSLSHSRGGIYSCVAWLPPSRSCIVFPTQANSASTEPIRWLPSATPPGFFDIMDTEPCSSGDSVCTASVPCLPLPR